MKTIRLTLLAISRFFVSAVFLVGAVKNILFWHETDKSIMDSLSEWQSHFGFSQDLQVFFSLLISWSSLLLLTATLFLLIGGLSLLLGLKEKLGLSLLILFLIPVTILYHPFWWADSVSHELQTAMFLKNLAILGCLLQILFRDASSQSQESERLGAMNF